MGPMSRTVTLFVPCYVDQLHPQSGIAAVRVLEGLGYRIRVHPDILCCGQPFSNSGAAGEGLKLARRWLDGMKDDPVVVVLSSSCTVQLRHALCELSACGGAARDTPGAAAETGGATPEVLEFCEFLDTRHPAAGLGSLERSVCLHSACHGLRDSDADRHARAILGRIEGLRVLRADRSDECCGVGGTFSTSFSALSVRMGKDRLYAILATGAREVVSTDVSCLLHLEGIARARGEPVAFRHVSEILAESAAPAEASSR